MIWRQREGEKADGDQCGDFIPTNCRFTRRTRRTEMKTSRFVAFVVVLMFTFSLNFDAAAPGGI